MDNTVHKYNLLRRVRNCKVDRAGAGGLLATNCAPNAVVSSFEGYWAWRTLSCKSETSPYQLMWRARSLRWVG